MGDGGRESGGSQDATDQTTGRKLTVPEAAEVLGISDDAIRSRIKRGTLTPKREGGRVFVVLGDTDRPTAQAQPTNRPDEERLYREMRERIAYLERQVEEEREARRRADTLLAQLMQRIPELEAPAESPPDAPGSPEPPTRTSKDTSARPSIREAEVAAEGRSEAEPRLLWERVAVVILSILAYIPLVVLPLWEVIPFPSVGYVLAGSLVLAWIVIPAVFGFRLGRKSSSLRFWRNVAPIAALLGLFSIHPASLLFGLPFYPLSFIPSLIPSLTYSFAAVLGNAQRRRTREKLMQERPSDFPQEATTRAQGWTPRQQAIVGLAGTIISSLIGLIGTILTVLDKT